MIDSFLFCGKAAFSIMGFAVGFQLLRKSRSDEGLGIHSLAAASIFVGGVGLAAFGLGEAMANGSRTLAISLLFAGDLMERIALVGLCIFIAKVFRPNSRWGLGTTIGLGLCLLASMGWELFRQPWPHYDASLASARSTQLTFALPFAWSAMESAGESSRGRRRLALGLISPAVVARFAIWSLGCASFVLICLLGALIPVVNDSERAGLASVLVAIRAVFYFVVTGAIWLGMFEPSFFERCFAGDVQERNESFIP